MVSDEKSVTLVHKSNFRSFESKAALVGIKPGLLDL
jgi:hypothetical protein